MPSRRTGHPLHPSLSLSERVGGWEGDVEGWPRPARTWTPPSRLASIPLIPSLKADLHILKPTEPSGRAAVAAMGSRSAGSHMSRSLLILVWSSDSGRSERTGPSAQPSPVYPMSPPVVDAFVDLLAGQEDVGTGHDHIQGTARHRQRSALECLHLLGISRDHHLDRRGKSARTCLGLSLASELEILASIQPSIHLSTGALLS